MDMAFGSTSRGRISHRGSGEEWKFGEEEEDIAWEGSEGSLQVGFRPYASHAGAAALKR